MTISRPDDAQRAVIDLPVGASGTVIGAPGSGKTAVLVERTAALLDSGAAAPGAIVVLTPTRPSATLLRDALGTRVRAATPGPLARSIGSLAFHIVRSAAVRRGEAPPQLLTGADQDRIIAQLLAGDEEDEADGLPRWPEHLGPLVRRSAGFRAELRAFLSEAAELGVGAGELEALGDPTWAAVAAFVRDYRNALAGMREAHRDSSELFLEAAAALRGAEAGSLGAVDELRVVMIDDAQELTLGGIALVEALQARGVAVLAFGDPDIGSGAFRGVTPELFARLAGALGPLHVLRDSHRADPAITRLARVATQQIGAAGRVEHRRAPGPEVETAGIVERSVAASPHEAIDRIAWALRSWHLDDGIAWGDMAVIAHDTRQITSLEAELAAREVPTRAAGIQVPLGEERPVRELVEIVRLGLLAPAERDPDDLVAGLRSPYGGFDGVALRRLRARLRHRELGDGGTASARALLTEALAEPALLDEFDTAEGRSARRFGETLARLHEMGAAGATAHELLWEAWSRARTLTGRKVSDVWGELAESSRPLAAETGRALDALVALFAAAKRFVERSPGEGPAPFVHNILDSDVPEDSLIAPERGGTVTLLTPASALGREFDAVVIAGLQDGVWPNVRLRGGLLESWRLPEALDAARAGRDRTEPPGAIDRRRGVLHDELRLFVRALTRARTRVLLSGVDDDDQSPSPLLGLVPPRPDEHAAPAREEHPLTLRGLVARHRRTLTTPGADDGARSEAAAQLAVLAREGVAGADSGEWYGVRDVTTEAPLIDTEERFVRVSPSRMEAFEECGLGWVIQALGGDTSTSPVSGLGTILHGAFEASPGGDLSEMRRVLDARWGELDFESGWLEAQARRRAEKALENLSAYAADFRAEGGRVVSQETPFRVVVPLGRDDADDGEARVIGVPEGQPRPDDVRPAALISGRIDRIESFPRERGDLKSRHARNWEPAQPRDPEAQRQAVIVDLKTGHYEQRRNDASVAHDAQLGAYQLAADAGLLDGVAPGEFAGARLLVVSEATGNNPYLVAHQHAHGPIERADFVRRVVDAARGMSSASFTAHIDTHCEGAFGVSRCAPHIVKAVSAS